MDSELKSLFDNDNRPNNNYPNEEILESQIIMIKQNAMIEEKIAQLENLTSAKYVFVPTCVYERKNYANNIAGYNCYRIAQNCDIIKDLANKLNALKQKVRDM